MNSEKILSIKMIGLVVIAYNTLNGVLSENKIIENITLKNKKYFFEFNGKKHFIKWEEKTKTLILPKLEILKSKISET